MYRPKIDKDQLHSLYVLSKEFGVPVTKILKIAIDKYLKGKKPKNAKLLKEGK